jgi:hypothetical protein
MGAQGYGYVPVETKPVYFVDYSTKYMVAPLGSLPMSLTLNGRATFLLRIGEGSSLQFSNVGHSRLCTQDSSPAAFLSLLDSRLTNWLPPRGQCAGLEIKGLQRTILIFRPMVPRHLWLTLVVVAWEAMAMGPWAVPADDRMFQRRMEQMATHEWDRIDADGCSGLPGHSQEGRSQPGMMPFADQMFDTIGDFTNGSKMRGSYGDSGHSSVVDPS